jgi:hypothetical protein
MWTLWGHIQTHPCGWSYTVGRQEDVLLWLPWTFCTCSKRSCVREAPLSLQSLSVQDFLYFCGNPTSRLLKKSLQQNTEEFFSQNKLRLAYNSWNSCLSLSQVLGLQVCTITSAQKIFFKGTESWIKTLKKLPWPRKESSKHRLLRSLQRGAQPSKWRPSLCSGFYRIYSSDITYIPLNSCLLVIVPSRQ